MLCLVCWAVDVRAAGGLAESAQSATRRFCFHQGQGLLPACREYPDTAPDAAAAVGDSAG